MKTFTAKYQANNIDSHDYGQYFGDMKPCVFDIETTGLSPASCKVVMTAMMIREGNNWIVTQFLAENHYEEDKVLIATMEYFAEHNIDYVITYNGAHFDIPFVNTRLDKLELPYKLELYNLDLYKFVKYQTVLPEYLDSLSQGSVERYLGIRDDRKDVITGAQNVQLFNEYARTGDANIENLILTHNREDVYQLGRILSYLSENNFKNLLKEDNLHLALAKFGFPISAGRFSARTQLKPLKKQLIITGSQLHSAIDAAYFPGIDCSYSAEFKSATGFYEIIIPIENKSNSVYVDLKALGLDNRFQELEACVNNYLILCQDGSHDQRCINLLCRELVNSLLDDMA